MLYEVITHAADRLVVGRMQAEGPAVLDEMADDLFEVSFHRRREIRPRLQEVLEVRRREGQHFAGAVVTVEVVALTERDGAGPVSYNFV